MYTIDLYKDGHLQIVCFSSRCEPLWVSESTLEVPCHYYYEYFYKIQKLIAILKELLEYIYCPYAF